jgi:hypothetical protein
MEGGISVIEERELIEVLITGRLECYAKTSLTFNPYHPGNIYDWEYERLVGKYLFKDSYRGFNPYSGVEYVFEEGKPLALWSCDYVGYAKLKPRVTEKDIYGFLKKGRGGHLKNGRDNFLKTFGFDEGQFKYQSRFNGSLYGLLQIEEIYHEGDLVAQTDFSRSFNA